VVAADCQQHLGADFNGHRIEQLRASTVVVNDHVACTFRGLLQSPVKPPINAAGHTAIEIDITAIAVVHKGANRNR